MGGLALRLVRLVGELSDRADAGPRMMEGTGIASFSADWCAWRIEQDYRELKDALGLDHFEGRTYGGSCSRRITRRWRGS
jgi:hypothetical protein